MAKIRIKSDPYKREISYDSFHEQTGAWEKIAVHNPDSRLREDESSKSFLPFKIKEIIDIVVHDYYNGSDKVQVIFEGTTEEYREVEKVCLSPDVADKISLSRTQTILENARSILAETKGIFKTVEPIIAKIVRDEPSVCKNLQKVSDALDDIIPICVFGNYSAGKSTFINALIGNEVLPSGGDPVTAKIFSIKRSEHPDLASIRFTYRNEPIELRFDAGLFRIMSRNLELDILEDIAQVIKDFAKQDLIAVVNKALEFINDYEKEDKADVDIGNVIEVDVPFSPNGILGQSHSKFVIFDTPGSNSNSHANHSAVLEEALQGFSNGIPVWVASYESLDSIDNAALCDKILSIDALDKRFTMIVLNKADDSDLPEGGFSIRWEQRIREYRAVEKIHPYAIFFVSSIMGLGAKNNGVFRDKHYRKTYRKQEDLYNDPEDEDYTTLFDFDILPAQIKADLNAICEGFEKPTDLVYANSGLFCIEKEIEDFASKYSAYNKCQMVYNFLDRVIEATTQKINQQTASLRRMKEKREQELSEKSRELNAQIDTLAADRKTAYHKSSGGYIQSYIDGNLDYSYDAEELRRQDDQTARRYAREADLAITESAFDKAKGTMLDHLKSHGQHLFSKEIRQVARDMGTAFLRDWEQVQANKRTLEDARRQIDAQTSDEIIGIVDARYKRSLTEATEKLSAAIKEYWQGRSQELKDALLTVVTGSDALSEMQRDKLSGIIMQYQPLEFNLEEEAIFSKAEFLRGRYLKNLIMDAERLNIKRLAKKYNDMISKSVSTTATNLNSSCFASYDTWQARLLEVIEENITDMNPQLRDMNAMIREEAERIMELETNQRTICASLEAIRQLMSWKEVDFEEVSYGR